jgi:hypothetical protein
MNTNQLLESLQKAYHLNLSARYKEFIINKEFEQHKAIEFKGYIKGPYTLDFQNELLSDVIELGFSVGISDIEDYWEESFQNYVPLASFYHPEVDEPKGFLVWDRRSEQMPVLLFDYDGPRLYPLAKSLDEFLSKLPNIENDIGESKDPSELEEDEFEFWHES